MSALAQVMTKEKNKHALRLSASLDAQYRLIKNQ